MRTIIIRPSVETEFKLEQLQKLFETMSLVDKTVVEDRIIYIFGEKEKMSSPIEHYGAQVAPC